MKVKIYLEYQCYPVWVYDDNGDLICNDLPSELCDDKELDKRFLEIRRIHDNLYTDNNNEFKYDGFSNNEDEEQFIRTINETIAILKSRLNKRYKIERKIVL